MSVLCCVYIMVTLYANNIKMTMMKDEMRSKSIRKIKSIISSCSRRRTCINALILLFLILLLAVQLSKQRKRRKKNAAQFLFIMFVLILRPVSLTRPIRIASCAKLTQLNTASSSTNNNNNNNIMRGTRE